MRSGLSPSCPPAPSMVPMQERDGILRQVGDPARRPRDPSRHRSGEAGDQPQKRGLAAAVRTGQRDHLSSAAGQVGVFEHRHAVEADSGAGDAPGLIAWRSKPRRRHRGNRSPRRRIGFGDAASIDDQERISSRHQPAQSVL